jgi:hypothetical protein
MATQFAFVATDHVQSRVVVIASDPAPPLALNEAGETLTPIWHLPSPAVGPTMDVFVDLQLERAVADSASADSR